MSVNYCDVSFMRQYITAVTTVTVIRCCTLFRENRHDAARDLCEF